MLVLGRERLAVGDARVPCVGHPGTRGQRDGQVLDLACDPRRVELGHDEFACLLAEPAAQRFVAHERRNRLGERGRMVRDEPGDAVLHELDLGIVDPRRRTGHDRGPERHRLGDREPLRLADDRGVHGHVARRQVGREALAIGGRLDEHAAVEDAETLEPPALGRRRADEQDLRVRSELEQPRDHVDEQVAPLEVRGPPDPPDDGPLGIQAERAAGVRVRRGDPPELCVIERQVQDPVTIAERGSSPDRVAVAQPAHPADEEVGRERPLVRGAVDRAEDAPLGDRPDARCAAGRRHERLRGAGA